MDRCNRLVIRGRLTPRASLRREEEHIITATRVAGEGATKGANKSQTGRHHFIFGVRRAPLPSLHAPLQRCAPRGEEEGRAERGRSPAPALCPEIDADTAHRIGQCFGSARCAWSVATWLSACLTAV